MLLDLISNPGKFQKCDPTQTENIKKKINDIARPLKDSNQQLYKALHRSGAFGDGHLYGLPKIHKDSTHPPLRPIISMSGTVTHDVAQYLNKIIRPFINKKYMLQSSDELLVHLADLRLNSRQSLVSLDVESLFTNVPIDATIEVILDAVYSHPTIPPPVIEIETMKNCSTYAHVKLLSSLTANTTDKSMACQWDPHLARRLLIFTCLTWKITY